MSPKTTNSAQPRFIDPTSAAVLGLGAFRARVQPDSRGAKRAAAQLRAFQPEEHEAWAQEMARTRDVDGWLSAEPEQIDPLRQALRELPELERLVRKLAADEPLGEPELFKAKQFLFYAAAALRASAALFKRWSLGAHWPAKLAGVMEKLHPQARPTPRFHLTSELDPQLKAARQSARQKKHHHRALRDALEAAILQDYPGRFDIHGAFQPDPTPKAAQNSGQIARLGADPRLAQSARGWQIVEPEFNAASAEIARAEAHVDALEAELRRRLSRLLAENTALFQQVEAELIGLDLRLAKARLRREIGGCWAELRSAPGVVITQGREPSVQRANEARGRPPQPVDLELGARPAVITGPNMGGKSVLLRLVGLSQWCAQAAMPVPAESFAFSPVRAIIYVGAEEPQHADAAAGLSAFGREVRRLVDFWGAPDSNHDAKRARLWLLDELGRGTHPEEGAEIAAEIIERLSARGERVLAATHFPKVAALKDAQKLRIAGLQDPARLKALLDDDSLDVHAALSEAMDYRPLPADNPDENQAAAVPRDARLVARALGLKLNGR